MNEPIRKYMKVGLVHFMAYPATIKGEGPIADRNGAYEWIGMINHSGQIGGSFREPVPIYNTSVRFKPIKPVKAISLLRSGKPVNFKTNNGWVELTVPEVRDFEMVVCTY
jgi:hypothetical protein